MQGQEKTRNGATRIGGGWMRPSVLAVVGVVMVVGAVAGYLRWATTPDNGASPVLGLIIPTILFLAIVVAATFFSFVRTVEIYQNQVVFILGARHLTVKWGDLVPPRSPLMLGITFKYRAGGRVQEQSALFVTRDQARAILMHPRCPRFDMGPKVWQSLGLTAPAAVQPRLGDSP